MGKGDAVGAAMGGGSNNAAVPKTDQYSVMHRIMDNFGGNNSPIGPSNGMNSNGTSFYRNPAISGTSAPPSQSPITSGSPINQNTIPGAQSPSLPNYSSGASGPINMPDDNASARQALNTISGATSGNAPIQISSGQMGTQQGNLPMAGLSGVTSPIAPSQPQDMIRRQMMNQRVFGPQQYR